MAMQLSRRTPPPTAAPSANQLWQQSLRECGQVAGEGDERTRQRYRELLRLHGLLRT